MTPTQGTYSATGTVCTVTLSGGHNLEIGQKVFLDFLTYNSGVVPKDDTFTVADTTNFTSTEFDVTIPNIPSGTITGNVNVSLPIDFVLLSQYRNCYKHKSIFPLIYSKYPSSSRESNIKYNTYRKLPLINHPTVQSGALNFAGSNNEIAPKQRGLMLRRGQALYVAASGATALTNGFYCNVQGGFY